jgi:hypothetical protein
MKHLYFENGTFHSKSSIILPLISTPEKPKKIINKRTWQKILYRIGVSKSAILEAAISTPTPGLGKPGLTLVA